MGGRDVSFRKTWAFLRINILRRKGIIDSAFRQIGTVDSAFKRGTTASACKEPLMLQYKRAGTIDSAFCRVKTFDVALHY